VAAAAVDLISSQIHRNEYGLPESPTTNMIFGQWVDGPTVRPLGPKVLPETIR